MGKIIALLLLMSATLLVAEMGLVGAQERSQSIATAADVPDGEWKAIRLRNLLEGAVPRVEAESDGTIRLHVIEHSQLEQMAEDGRAIFASQTDTALDFTLQIPQSGDYNLILDNRRGSEDRHVSGEPAREC